MFQLGKNYVYHALQHALGRSSHQHPLAAYVYLTYRCNLDCIYCNDGETGSYVRKKIDRELAEDEWLEVFRLLRRETDAVILTGGEPTARNDLDTLVHGLKAMGYSLITLLTNGVNLDERLEVLDALNMVIVSLDTLDADRAEHLLGRPGVHKRILANIELAARLRRKHHFGLTLAICLTAGNLDDALSVIDFALERDIGITVAPEVRGTQPAPGLVGNPEYKAILDRLIALKRRGADILGSIPFLEGVRDFEPYGCLPGLLARVKPNGDLMYPCNRRSLDGLNLLELGGYARALEEAESRLGPASGCPHSCHEGCYMDFSLLVQRPWSLLYETWLLGVRRPLERLTRNPGQASFSGGR